MATKNLDSLMRSASTIDDTMRSTSVNRSSSIERQFTSNLNTRMGKSSVLDSRVGDDDSDEEYYDEDEGGAERRGAVGKKASKKFDFPEPIYGDVINIGYVAGLSRVEQVLDQLEIQDDEFVFWTSKDKIKINIPTDLY